MKYVMGLDPSLTSTGLIILDESGAIAHRQRITSAPSGSDIKSRLVRYAAINHLVYVVARQFAPEVICIEGYSFGSNMPGMIDRVEFGGLLRYTLVSAGNRLLEVTPTCLKRWATGKGAFPGGGKTPLIVAMTSRYSVQLGTDDEYDAYALARMAHQIAGLSEPETVFQRETIAVVLAPKVKTTKKRKAVTT